MKTLLATLALGFSLTMAPAWAQSQQAAQSTQAQGKVEATAPVAPAPDAGKAPPALPKVESVDIFKQNQAERSQTQPGNLAPTYRIVKEGTKNYSSLPGLETGVLIQPKAQFPGQARPTTAGQAWREYRNGPLTKIGGWLFVLGILGVAAMYFLRGPIRLTEPRTGRLIERFTRIERLAHWSTAISFVILAVSGLIMLFGKYVILPVFGHTLFGLVTYFLKTLHNFVGPVFTISLLVTFVIFVKDNFPRLADIGWILRGGGLFGGRHVSAGRFNAGEKLWFWGGVVFLGLIVSASGFVLDMLVPGIAYTRGNMQVANVIHLVAAVLIATASLGHIYLGTIGMEGAYAAMRTGYVDDAWAKEHHDLWYDDIQAGKVPRIRTPEHAPDAAKPAQI